MKKLPSKKYLHQKFIYDKKSDTLYNKRTKKIAGTNRPDGYRSVYIDGGYFKLHRVIYKMFNGQLKNGFCINHIDGNRTNNRPDNLEQVTVSENNKNVCLKRNNTTGFPGLFKTRNGKYGVVVNVNKKRVYFGTYTDKNQAVLVRKRVQSEFGFGANHGIQNIQSYTHPRDK